jgi:hypothetical protein
MEENRRPRTKIGDPLDSNPTRALPPVLSSDLVRVLNVRIHSRTKRDNLKTLSLPQHYIPRMCNRSTSLSNQRIPPLCYLTQARDVSIYTPIRFKQRANNAMFPILLPQDANPNILNRLLQKQTTIYTSWIFAHKGATVRLINRSPASRTFKSLNRDKYDPCVHIGGSKVSF